MVSTPLIAPLVFLLGLMLGSFASALSWRIPRGFSWTADQKDGHAKPVRSQCTHCGHVLGVLDLFPLFSWLMLKGRCRYCGVAIGARYPLIELGTAAACLGVYAAWGLTAPGLALIAAMPFLMALLVIDIDHMILPDQLNLLLAVAGAVFLAVQGGHGALWGIFLSHLAAALVYGGVLWLTGLVMGYALKKDALGGGDVKFAAAAGLWLGAGAFPFFLIASGAAGVIWGGISRFLRGQPLFPFGPALIGAFYIGMILRGLNFTVPGLFF